MHLLMDYRVVEMHRVAKLASFRNRLMSGTMGIGPHTIGAVLVSIYHDLPCNKNQ